MINDKHCTADSLLRAIAITERNSRIALLRRVCQENPSLVAHLIHSADVSASALGIQALRWHYDNALCEHAIVTAETPSMRRRAVQLLIRGKMNDDFIASIFAKLGMRPRTEILKGLLRGRRDLLATALVSELPEVSRRHLLYLTGSDHLVGKLRDDPRLLQRWQWRRICKSRPSVAMTCLRVIANSDAAPEKWVVDFVSDLLLRLPRRQPQEDLESLLLALSKSHSTESLWRERGSPQLLRRLLMASTDNSEWSQFWRLVSKVETTEHIEASDLEKIAQFDSQVASTLLADAKSRRKWVPLLYPFLRFHWRNRNLELNEMHLTALPLSIRRAEVERILRLPHMVTRDATRLLYQCYLPWDEAIAEIRRFIRDPEIGTRCAAHQALGTLCLLNSEHLAEVLEIQKGSMREIPAVRNEILLAIIRQPIRRFNESHCDAVDEIVQRTIEAKDLHWSGRNNIGTLFTRFYAKWPEKALRWMRIGSHDQIQFTLSGCSLVTEETRKLTMSLIDSSASRTPSEWLNAMHQILEPLSSQLDLIPGVADAVFGKLRALEAPGDRNALSRILLALRNGLPLEYLEGVCDLVSRDSTWLCFDCIASAVAVHKPELLLPWLDSYGCATGELNPHGAFWFSPIPLIKLHGLTIDIQRKYNELLIRFAHEKARSDEVIAALLRCSIHLDKVAPQDTLLNEALNESPALKSSDGHLHLKVFALKLLVKSGRRSVLRYLGSRDDKIPQMRMAAKWFEAPTPHAAQLQPSVAMMSASRSVSAELASSLITRYMTLTAAEKAAFIEAGLYQPEGAMIRDFISNMRPPVETEVLLSILSHPITVNSPLHWKSFLDAAVAVEDTRVLRRVLRFIERSSGEDHTDQLVRIAAGKCKSLRSRATKLLFRSQFRFLSADCLLRFLRAVEAEVPMTVNVVTTFLESSLTMKRACEQSHADKLAEMMADYLETRPEMTPLQLRLIFSLYRADEIASRFLRLVNRERSQRKSGALIVASLREAIGVVSAIRRLPEGAVEAFQELGAESLEMQMASFFAFCSQKDSCRSSLTWSVRNILKCGEYKRSESALLAACAMDLDLPCDAAELEQLRAC